MLQVARLAPNLLLEARERVVEFLHSQFHEDGGGKDRAGSSDLYYTVFAVEGLLAMQVDPPFDATTGYLHGFGEGEGLDLVHLSCLARCWAAMPAGALPPETARGILRRIDPFRATDGGYAPRPGARTGTVYHSFLALGSYQDLQADMPDVGRLANCLDALATQDGAYANDCNLTTGTTPATAAAVTLLRHLDRPIPARVGEWLLARCHPEGGFLAMPKAPMPDLLSTATALHALSGMHVSFDSVKDRCLDYIDTLWTGRAFCGHWADDAQDSEYTYYALLALGHLSL